MSYLVNPFAMTASGAADPSFVAASSYVSAAAANLVLSLPSGVASGDLLIAVCESLQTMSDPTAVDPAADWTPLTSVVHATAGGSYSSLHLWTHEYTGSTPDLTWLSSAVGRLSGLILGFRNVATIGTPETSSIQNNLSAHTRTGITTTANNAIVVAAISVGVANVPSSPSFASGPTLTSAAFSTLDNNDAALMYAYGTKSTAGATGDLSFTVTGAGRCCTAIMELRS